METNRSHLDLLIFDNKTKLLVLQRTMTSKLVETDSHVTRIFRKMFNPKVKARVRVKVAKRSWKII